MNYGLVCLLFLIAQETEEYQHLICGCCQRQLMWTELKPRQQQQSETLGELWVKAHVAIAFVCVGRLHYYYSAFKSGQPLTTAKNK